uniref:Ring finger protein 213 n=1 Tax=Knipowitschia caucasica TaxID=637954 RepID=A0AAV2KEC8_KNICA
MTISQLFENNRNQPEALEVNDDIYVETEKKNTDSEKNENRFCVLDTTTLLRSCVQRAVGMLRDQMETGFRSTLRVEILLTLLDDDDDEIKEEFSCIVKRHLHTLLATHVDSTIWSNNWVMREASNIDALQEGGTFRNTLWNRIQAVVIPMLAHLVAISDRDQNLNLLLDKNCGLPLKKLWLDIFGNDKLLQINSESRTVLVQNYITPKMRVGCSMPFSWRIRDYLEDMWVHALQNEGQTQLQFDDFFWNTPLGRFIGKEDQETQTEFYHRYLQDYISLTMNVSCEEEMQLLSAALNSCVNELKIKLEATDRPTSLSWIHAAHEFKNRLQNLSRIICIKPQVTGDLLRNPSSRDGPEMILDVYAAFACVENLEPTALDTDDQRQTWLRQVHQLQVPIELVCAEDCVQLYGERSKAFASRVLNAWNRIFCLSLFVEHMLVGIEELDQKLVPSVLQNTQRLWQMLEKNTNMKTKDAFETVIGLLKTCKEGAVECIFRFGLPRCSVCIGDPQDPICLPCQHIYCLVCIKQWLVPGQMYCPYCMQQVNDDFAIVPSNDIRVQINTHAQFRRRCNAFFVELVSSMCFKDNSPPSSEVVSDLLSFLMHEANPALIPGAQRQRVIVTKEFSPFDESLDKSPVVRSVVLKLLLKYSFDKIEKYLKHYLHAVEESNLLDDAEKTELYSLYINCFEDSMFEKLCLEDESIFLQLLSDYPQQILCSSTVDSLQLVARVRLNLDIAAGLIIEDTTLTKSQAHNAVDAFLKSVKNLCQQSKNDWYRVYLIRKLGTQHGVAHVQNLLKFPQMSWIFPKEILEKADEAPMDFFLVCGPDYQTIRNAVAKVVMDGTMDDLDGTCERVRCVNQSRAVLLLLALYREVTTWYKQPSTNLHPKPAQIDLWMGYIGQSKVLTSPELKAFAQALVTNQLGPLTLQPALSRTQSVLIELTVHLAAVLLCGNQGILGPLKQLALTPRTMQAAFLPSMPEDKIIMAQQAMGQKLRWYLCPNGHPCTIGECGRPMERSRCVDCGADIGGINHIPAQGFMVAQLQGDRTQSGHILGDPGRRNSPDMLDTKSLSPVPFAVVRMITHMAMMFGLCNDAQMISTMIKPRVVFPGKFLFAHLTEDQRHLTKSLGKGADDAVITVHLIISSLLHPPHEHAWPVGYDNQLSTNKARNNWENKMSNIIAPLLKNMERQLKQVNALIRSDDRISASPIMKVMFGDPQLFLDSLPKNSLIHCSTVWSSREKVSLFGLTHILEQNGGKEALPFLWTFLHREAEYRLVKFLPDILTLQKHLVKKFQNITEVSGTIADFLEGQQSVSLKAWYEKHIKIVLNTWNELRVFLATNGDIKLPPSFCEKDLDRRSDFRVLLPSRRGPGLCSTALVSYLIFLQNDLLYSVDRLTGEDTSYKVSPVDLTDLHVIRYELDKDLMPLVLSNTQYSIEKGQETLHEYDLPKIQQQIVSRFLLGKPLITLNGIPTLVHRHDRNYENILKDVNEKIKQEPLQTLIQCAVGTELDSYSEVCEALSAVEIALGFLAMTGGDASMQLSCYLEDVLKMATQTPPHILKALSMCSLKHCAALWQLLGSLKSQGLLKLKRDPFEHIPEEYKQVLSVDERGLLARFFSKNSAETFLLEMHEFLVLMLNKPKATDTFKPEWGLKETLVSYMERKDMDVPPELEELFPEEICLSHNWRTLTKNTTSKIKSNRWFLVHALRLKVLARVWTHLQLPQSTWRDHSLRPVRLQQKHKHQPHLNPAKTLKSGVSRAQGLQKWNQRRKRLEDIGNLERVQQMMDQDRRALVKKMTSHVHLREIDVLVVRSWLYLISLVSDFVSSTSLETPQTASVPASLRDTLDTALDIIRQKIHQCFRGNLLPTRDTKEIEFWNNILSIKFRENIFTNVWKDKLTKDFEDRYKQATPMQQIEYYCKEIDNLSVSYPYVASSVEVCALDAVTALCQTKSEGKILERISLNWCGKFGKLISAIVEKSWPKRCGGTYCDDEEAIMRHLLTWTASKNIFQLYGGKEGVTEKLSDVASERIAIAVSSFTNVVNQVAHGNIKIGLLNILLEKKDAFLELSQINVPTEKVAKMKRLFQHRQTEVNAVYHEKQLLDILVTMSNKLEEVIKVDVAEVKERQHVNIEEMPLNSFMEVQLLDQLSSDKAAKIIMTVKKTLHLQRDFSVLKNLLQVNEEKEGVRIDQIDNDLIQAKKDLVDITETRKDCLRELGLRGNFVHWVKEALEDINELKVFVDLASISAGENDMDVDRVACFHDAVLGYSPLLYELERDADFDKFNTVVKKLWRALENDCDLPKKLRDSARHLEWLKTVKDSHGSVELSSLSLASSINQKGIYIISAQHGKKLCLDKVLELRIPEEHDAGQHIRNYSLEDLRELQNKLMLMSGKGDQGRHEVDYFTEVFDNVQRLSEAFIALYTADLRQVWHELQYDILSRPQEVDDDIEFRTFTWFKVHMVPQAPLTRVQEYLHEHYVVSEDQCSAAAAFKDRLCVGIVSSTRSGVGKSLYIKRLYQKLKHSTKKTTAMNCIRLIEPTVDEDAVFQSLLNNTETKALAVFHLDVTASVQHGLHEFLFKLLFLRYLMNSEGKVWKCNEKQLYVVEILERPKTTGRKAEKSSLIDVLPNIFCRPPKEILELELRKIDDPTIMNGEDPLMDDEEFRTNTTEAISSIKEVLCDKTVQGEGLASGSGLQIIAACNPYRKHTDEMIERLESAGLGYRVRAEETNEKLVLETQKHTMEIMDPDKKVLDEAKLVLLKCATPDSVVRLDSSELPRGESDHLAKVYNEEKHNGCLSEFILALTGKEQLGNTFFTEVTTFSRLLTASDLKSLEQNGLSAELLSVQQFDTEHSFLKKIRNFLTTGRNNCESKILIVQCDYDEASQSANLIASAKHSSINEIRKTVLENPGQRVFVYIITRLPRMIGGTSYVGFYGGPWKSVHIDDLRKSNEIISDIKLLQRMTISQLFENNRNQPEALEVNDDIYVETEKKNTDSEKNENRFCVLDTTTLLRSCVQRAVGMLRDQMETGFRSTLRVEILLTLLDDDDDEIKEEFSCIVKRHLHTLLATHVDSTIWSNNWVMREASNIDALQEGGTFRNTLWNRIQAVVIPMLAHLVAISDRDQNLNLLLDKNCGLPLKKLWLDIFGNDKLLQINSESRTVLVQNYITPKMRVGCSMPFSWRIRDYLEDMWVHALQNEGQTQLQFDDFFWNTPLGRFIGKEDQETQTEFYHRYLQDYISLTMNVSCEEEMQLLSAALNSCVNELKIKLEATDRPTSLSWIHAAYHEFKNRLQNLSRIICIKPQVTGDLLRNPSSRDGPEMILDVYAAFACVENLEPTALDTDDQRQTWLRQVHQLQVPIELVCAEDCVQLYGERSKTFASRVLNAWNRIFCLSLFVEHMLVGIEELDQKLVPSVLQNTQRLWQMLEKNTNMKTKDAFETVIGLLKTCKEGAVECIFRFGLPRCSVCIGDPQDPICLPCQHIYCLVCIKQWLVPGQMYCPYCMQQVNDDFAIVPSNDIRVQINTHAQFRRRCNAFFVELVSSMCFKDNSPPSSEVVSDLLSFLMHEANPALIPGAQRQRVIVTKEFSPFDESLDKSPVVRSVVLKLLLKYSFDKIEKYLKHYLHAVEESNLLDDAEKTELYSLYINCFEDSMFEKLCLEDESIFLQDLSADPLQILCSATVKSLQLVARVRLNLDTAAGLIIEDTTLTKSQAHNAVDAFLKSVKNLCQQSKNDWYRVYLIRKLGTQHGVAHVQNLLKVHQTSWIFPKEILEKADEAPMDLFLVCGPDYQTIRNAVAKVVMDGTMVDLDGTCERVRCVNQSRAVLLLLALYREVTTWYKQPSTNLHPKPAQINLWMGYIGQSKVLTSPELKAFAQALVTNQLGPLTLQPALSRTQSVLIELTVHLAAVLLCGNQGILGPLKQLALPPGTMQLAFLPSMPEDKITMAQQAMGQGLQWYLCPNGHPCTIGECGQPMERSRCVDCGADIGGINHIPAQGFSIAPLQGDRTQSGHILGDPGRRNSPDMLDTKSLSPVPFAVVRMITHMAMMFGLCNDAQMISTMIKPRVVDPGKFLFAHLTEDQKHLTKSLGKGADDAVITVHLIISSLLHPPHEHAWPVDYDNQLSTNKARNNWETKMSNIIAPLLKNMERQLKQVNALIRSDDRISASPIMKVMFGDPQLFLDSLPKNSLIHCSTVWSSREKVSLFGLTHILEQNGGKEALPFLWTFLHREAEYRLVKFLPDILTLQKHLVKKFQNITELSGTIADFLEGQQSVSLKAWYEKHIKIVLNTWNELRVFLATNGDIKLPPSFCEKDLDRRSDFRVLLPSRRGPGLCSTALVSYLIFLQNDLLYSVDRLTGEDTSYKVSPVDLTDLHVIRYELDKDLMPLVLSNTQYSIEKGQETLHEYDLPKIQQQIVSRFLLGKPLITLNGIPTLVHRHDRDYENILKDVNEKIKQEPLQTLIQCAVGTELDSYSEVCEALSAVEIALGFLAMTGGDASMQLSCYLEDVLKMATQTPPHILKALSMCSLKHCAALWQLLGSLKSQGLLKLKRDPFEHIPEEYKQVLSVDERGLLAGFFSKNSAETFLLEMHEFLVLMLNKPKATDTFKPEWGLKETLVSYMERKDMDVPPELEELFPEEICLSQSCALS